mmetsp:Transcript_35558/g.100133  ORF Transcript_35558/g.100133 Transcript_35558/m.100133 type:complete len:167 (+) Transcript_35558:793-1293(+)
MMVPGLASLILGNYSKFILTTRPLEEALFSWYRQRHGSNDNNANEAEEFCKFIDHTTSGWDKFEKCRLHTMNAYLTMIDSELKPMSNSIEVYHQGQLSNLQLLEMVRRVTQKCSKGPLVDSWNFLYHYKRWEAVFGEENIFIIPWILELVEPAYIQKSLFNFMDLT